MRSPFLLRIIILNYWYKLVVLFVFCITVFVRITIYTSVWCLLTYSLRSYPFLNFTIKRFMFSLFQTRLIIWIFVTSTSYRTSIAFIIPIRKIIVTTWTSQVLSLNWLIFTWYSTTSHITITMFFHFILSRL